MPTPSIFEGINPRGTQTFIPCKDKAAVAWADAGKYVGKNKLDVPNIQTIGSSIFYADADKYVTSPQSDERSWNYNNSNLKISLKAGKYNLRVFRKTACSSGYNGFKVYNDSTVIYQNETIEGAVNAGDIALNLANDSNIGIFYKLGNGAYAFQITEEGVPTTPYTPYIPDNTELMTWEANAVLGAYNLCNPTAASSGIVTKNDDGTYTANGTLAAGQVFEIGRDALPILEIGKQYKLVGCPSTKPTGTYLSIRARSSSDISSSDTGNGVIWDVTNATKADAFMFIYLAAGTYDNVVFKPMVTPRLDATYADYAQYSGMTNRELTENVLVKKGTITSDFTIGDNTKLRRQGNLVSLTLFLNAVTQDANQTIATLPSGFGAETITPLLGWNISDNTPVYLYIEDRSYIKTGVGLSNKNIRLTAIWANQ